MENEVIAGREILNAAADMAAADDGTAARRCRRPGVIIVSCPRCGRHSFDTHAFMARWMTRLYMLDKDITVAVMGCPVNGPGEARHADLGITGSGGKTLIFRHGEVIRDIDAADADAAFEEELDRL
jgi:(E)-4-hydroxy-3-methylbut-2-enyl-diphosphate synthase